MARKKKRAQPGPRPKPARELRAILVPVRMTEDEWMWARKLADAAHIPLATWARQIVLEGYKPTKP